MSIAMSNPRHIELIQAYLAEVAEQFNSGHAIEHAYRPALQRLINGLGDVTAVNDPKHSEHGAPDFVFLKKSNAEIIKGYAEAKDINVSLDKTEKTDQMKRYAGYQNLVFNRLLWNFGSSKTAKSTKPSASANSRTRKSF
jgi:hypothetical protein